jgi:ribosomal protein S18 acetylase RimI-like enzyme
MLEIPLTMVRTTMLGLPHYECPTGYSVRTFTPGDEQAWARIEAAAGAFQTESAALAHFQEEFEPVVDRLPGRMLFLEHDETGPIGTTTAWFGEYAGQSQGRIHWVGIVPEFQGRGLSKPLLSMAMSHIASEFDQAYLTTETTSYRGINLYLSFGFEPVVRHELDRTGWVVVGKALRKGII